MVIVGKEELIESFNGHFTDDGGCAWKVINIHPDSDQFADQFLLSFFTLLSFFLFLHEFIIPFLIVLLLGRSNGTRTAESEWNFLLLSIVECSTSRTQNYKGSSVGSLRLKFITMIGFFQLKKFQIYWISIQGCFLFILQGGGREWKTTKKGRKAERRKKRKKLKTTRWWRKIRDLKVNAVVDFSRCHEIGGKFLLLFFRLLLASLFFFIIFDSRKQPVVAAEHCENESFVFKLRFHPNPLSSSISRKERETHNNKRFDIVRLWAAGWWTRARGLCLPVVIFVLLLWKDI